MTTTTEIGTKYGLTGVDTMVVKLMTTILCPDQKSTFICGEGNRYRSSCVHEKQGNNVIIVFKNNKKIAMSVWVEVDDEELLYWYD
jgi:hypothetical protein